MEEQKTVKEMTADEREQDFKVVLTTFYRNAADCVLKNTELMQYLRDGGFFTAPASTKYHGAYEGGLYEHSRDVMLTLEMFTEKLDLNWTRKESPLIVGMFHDLCKCDNYIKTDKGYIYNTNQSIPGHGSKSVQILSRYLELTEEESLCIRYHMGAYEKEDWKGFDEAIRKYPNVLMTHTADMMASKLNNV